MHRQLIVPVIAAAAAALALTSPAGAICLITNLDLDVDLIPNAANTVLSSAGPGGQGATFRIFTALGTNLTVDSPAGFTSAPPGGDANVSFTTTVSSTGNTVFGGLLGGLSQPLGIGTSTITVNVTAEKTAGIFPAGEYLVAIEAHCT